MLAGKIAVEVAVPDVAHYLDLRGVRHEDRDLDDILEGRAGAREGSLQVLEDLGRLRLEVPGASRFPAESRATWPEMYTLRPPAASTTCV